MKPAALLLVLCAAVAADAQEDQTPRPTTKDSRGLLKINRDFYELAASTGGDFYFWAPGEFAASQLQVPIQHEEVLLAYGSLDAKRVFEIPVESGVRTLTVFAGIQRKDLAVLVRPDGLVVQTGDRGAAVQSFQHMFIATVDAPPPGIWKLELTGAGIFSVTAHVRPGDEGPQLVDFDFVEKRGRPGHEGMFPLKRSVRAAESLPCELAFSGTVQKLQLEFVAKDGATIGRAAVERSDDEHYAARCTVPKEPFRVAVSGVDAAGRAFRRVERGLRSTDR